MKSNLKTFRIQYHDHHFGKQKHYDAFRLQDVMQFGYGDTWEQDAFTDAVFKARDGYESICKIEKLHEDGGYIAFKDLDTESGWEPVSRRKANPGPFYLLWTGASQKEKDHYCWPWQLASVNILEFQSQYPAVYPANVKKDTTIFKGFSIFKALCMRCHAMDTQGGKVGPDLNAPQSIVMYRSKNMIKEFIRHPSKYRHTNMPDHRDLTDDDLNSLIDYFWFKSKR